MGREPGADHPVSSVGPVRRRTLILLLAAALVGLPAGVLRALCAGQSCDAPSEARARAPFCSLPEDVRTRLADGFRDGRSPEVFGIAGDVAVRGHSGPGKPAWPSVHDGRIESALAFWGAGIDEKGRIRDGTTLDAVAPTVAEVIGLERPHPEVRSGKAIDGIASGAPPRLVLLAVLDVTPQDLSDRPGPFLDRIFTEGAATLAADPGALPLDPAATMTTIGAGGLPRQHGITGATIRNDDGRLVRAWGRGAPPSVIATLGDDLDDHFGGAPRIGMVATDPSERGLIGGDWYVDSDRDDFAVAGAPHKAARSARALIRSGYGRDETPDLLGIVLRGETGDIDAALAGAHRAARAAAGKDVAVVIAAIGVPDADGSESVPWNRIARSVSTSIGAPVVDGAAAGGLFIDQKALVREEISEDEIVNAMRSVRIGGARLFVDVFPAISISFERYC